MEQDKFQRIIEERAKDYSDPLVCHTNIGMAWAAILDQAGVTGANGTDPIPPRVVALMMASLKIIRAATTYRSQDDSYDDAHVYLKFAQEFSGKTDETP